MSIVISTHQPTRPVGGPQRRPLTTAIVVDECDDIDAARLAALIGTGSGPATVVVTRRSVPPCVIGFGAGLESMVMWHECQDAWARTVAGSDRAIRALVSELGTNGFGPIETVDCVPRWGPFRRLARREVDSVVRALRRIRPYRTTIDPAHRLAVELESAVTSEDRTGAGRALRRPHVRGGFGVVSGNAR